MESEAKMTEQEEFEFRHRLESESQGRGDMSLKGIAAEAGKGFLRGASEVASMAPKAVGTMLLGPMGGNMVSDVMERVAAPSKALIAPKPEGHGEQFAGTAAEILGSGIVGGGAASLRSAAGTGMSALGGAIGEQIGGEGGQLAGTILPFGMAAFPKVAKSLMQSALKPTIKDLKSGDAARAIDTLLEEGISPTMGGMEKLRAKIGDLNQEIKTAIAGSSATIDKFAAGKHLQDTFDRFSKQVNPGADIEAIKSAWKEFLNHPMLGNSSRIPVQMAQEMKQSTYKVLNKKYGQVGAASDEAQKSIARGLKDEIANAVPGIAKVNAKESELLNALGVGERRALLEINKNPMGLSLLANNPAAWAAFMADRSAAFKALLARMLHSGAPVATPGARIVMGAESAQGIGQ